MGRNRPSRPGRDHRWVALELATILRLRREHRTVLEHCDEAEPILARSVAGDQGAHAAARRAAARLTAFLERALPDHFALEEHFLPVLATPALDEHAILREALIALRVDPDPVTALRLTATLRRHIAAEERLLRALRTRAA
jgi:hypothetical protein